MKSQLRNALLAVTAVATLTLATGAFAQNGANSSGNQDAASGYGPGMMGYGYPGAGPGRGYGMMGGYGGYGPGMMGGYGGFGPGMMGYGMMGGYGGGYGPGMMGGYGGYGPGMMGPGMGYGMMGGYGGAYGPGMMGGFYGLNLSNDQQKKIAQIEENTRKKNWDLMGKLQEEHVTLQNLLAQERPDPGKVGAEYDRVSGLQKQMMQNGLQARNQIESVLTKEQRDQLRQGWSGGSGVPGYRGPGMMQGGSQQQSQ